MKRSALATSVIEPLESRIAPAVVAVVNLDLIGPGAGYPIDIQGDPNYFPGFHPLAGAGDFNGDGLGDYLIGSPSADAGNGTSGAAYLIFGVPGGFPTGIDVTRLSPATGVVFGGAALSDGAGASVAAAGDVNGDGLADVIVGAPYAEGGAAGSGVAYVVMGRTGGPEFVELAALNGVNGFAIHGAGANDGLGGQVSGAGDVNGDGLEDVIVSAANADAGGGAAFVVYGVTPPAGVPPPSIVTLANLTAAQGVKIASGEADSNGFRIAVSAAGDVNGDGVDDVLIGVPFASPGGLESGAVYAVFGKLNNALGTSVDVAALDGSNGFAIHGAKPGDHLGDSVAAAGDVNADGKDDIFIAAPDADSNGTDSGSVHVLYGKSGSFPAVIGAKKIRGDIGISLEGEARGNRLGSYGLSAAGDFNGDGIDDIVVSANRFAGGEEFLTGKGRGAEPDESRAAYIVFGKGDGALKGANLSKLNGTNGVKFIHAFNMAFSSAGDVNQDGFDDLLLNGSSSSVLVFGTKTFIATNAGGKTAKFTDLDGDVITVKVSKGSLSSENFELGTAAGLFARGAGGGGASMFSALMLGDEFDGAKVSIKAKQGGGGDGQVSLGSFNAAGVSLSSVSVGGIVGGVNAGNGAKNAIKKLVIGTLGNAGGGPSASSTLEGGVKKFKVLKDVTNSSMMFNSGGADSVKKMLVKGSMTNSTMVSTGSMKIAVLGSIEGTQIQAGDFIKSLALTKDIIDSDILAPGDPDSGKPAIKNVFVGGSVENSRILAGYSALGVVANGNGSIGRVKVRGDFTASSIVAGVDAGADGNFGTGDDVAVAGGTDGLFAAIASIVIKGAVKGTPANGADHFGFVAEEITKFKTATGSVSLTNGPGNDLAGTPFGATGDVTLLEVAAPV